MVMKSPQEKIKRFGEILRNKAEHIKHNASVVIKRHRRSLNVVDEVYKIVMMIMRYRL